MKLANGTEVIIGLEVHVELKTRTKLFCSCPTTFGQAPNTQVCPVCLGLPGVLPQLNRQAVQLAVRAALALGCRINPRSKFDRKNYFYPDLPKGYQISQYDQPLAEWGYLDIEGDEGPRRVRIRRIHLEEEAGKLAHEGASLWTASASLVDLNRAGLPLIEIVSEPDLRSPAEARAYLAALRTVLSYVDVSDLRMEEGSLRCDANISLCPAGYSGPLEALPRVEIKNINSIRNVVRALEYEVDRQAAILDAGEVVRRETRGFDDQTGRTLSQRGKEEAHDYRYFPEPDLPPLVLDEQWIAEQQRDLPPLPDAVRARLEAQGLAPQDARIIAGDPEAVRYFDAVCAQGADARQAAVWMLGDLARLLNDRHLGYAQSPVPPGELARLIALIASGRLSGRMAKEVLEVMAETGRGADAVVEERGLSQIADPARLRAEAERVIAEQPKVVADYLAGKERALAFLVGQVMKATRGQAKPDLVNAILKELLDALRTPASGP
jgi:aspartyl-tRNA(Asn)/glutamyl-tRNA(Gln) amidotransferase subunit B